MATLIFWLSLTCILYVYLGYPLLLMVWRKLKPWPVQKRTQEPFVSLVIAMHNESGNVHAKMQNSLALDYPPEKLQIIVSLDAPTDGTDALVREYQSARVAVTESSTRRGKAGALNNALSIATGEIVVFADARQRFELNAIRELVANFADSSVGAVSGELILLDAAGNEATNTVGIYWRYEKAIRSMESDIHSVPGASGAIYAIRRNLFKPLPSGTVLDDVVIPMRIAFLGMRAIFDREAKAYDRISQTPELEYEKKCRTLMGNYELFAELPQLLVPWKNPIFVQTISHKAGRLAVPYCLAALLVSNAFLLHGFYALFFGCQSAWYVLAFVGWLLSIRHRKVPVSTTATRARSEITNE
jgi:cellulose synthase/poly-beta-1,6-N-acetylglucosamine synthase-like glycosyltransferase